MIHKQLWLEPKIREEGYWSYIRISTADYNFLLSYHFCPKTMSEGGYSQVQHSSAAPHTYSLIWCTPHSPWHRVQHPQQLNKPNPQSGDWNHGALIKQVLLGVQPLNELKDKQADYCEITHSRGNRFKEKIQRMQIRVKRIHKEGTM